MPTKDKIRTLKQLRVTREKWKTEGEEVVFSNGCFDLLHLGHVDYLEKASELGTKLIIGLNTDDSVRKLKGESRPINSEYARARILASLAFVDAVILFGEDTPLQLITSLLPDVLVKGDDYSTDTIVGAKEVLAHGGTVKTIGLVEGFSTTGTIEKMRDD